MIATTTISMLCWLSVLVVVMAASSAQGSGRGGEDYIVRRTTAASAPLLDDDPDAWATAVSTAWGPPEYRTTFAALWNEEGLFVRFDAVDPSPWHTLTERDDHLWNEEVVEIFIDPDGDGRNYAEIEISPHNVVCDLVIFEGAPNLRSDIGWDLEGMRSAVHPRGDGWIAVAVLPWDGFARLPAIDGTRLPPAPDDRWSFNVFRIKRPGGAEAPEAGAVYAAWSPTSGPSFHEPAAFRSMRFGE